MPHSVFMGIDYDADYKACVVTEPNDTEHRFATGNPPEDWKAACRKAYELTQTLGVPCMTLSSLDGFVFDVPGWRFDENDMLVKDERDA